MAAGAAPRKLWGDKTFSSSYCSRLGREKGEERRSVLQSNTMAGKKDI